MISEVTGGISWVLLALQISLALRKSLVTFRISSWFIVVSSCFCMYESSRSLPSKYHVTFGGGDPPITSHNKDIALPSLNGCGTLGRALLSSVNIIGFPGGTASAKLNFDHRNSFLWYRRARYRFIRAISLSLYHDIDYVHYKFIPR